MKLREDPLLAIKQQEQAAYQALMSNPLRLKALREKAGIKDKSDPKEKHKRRHHREERNRLRSPSRDGDEGLYSRDSRRAPRRDSYSRSPPRRRRSASPPPRRGKFEAHDQHRRGGDDSRYRRSRSPEYYRRRSPSRNGDGPHERDGDHARTDLRSSSSCPYHR